MIPKTTFLSDNILKKLILILLVVAVVLIICLTGSLFIFNKTPIKQENNSMDTKSSGSSKTMTLEEKQNDNNTEKNVVCKKYYILDEALKNPDIACILDLSNKGLSEIPKEIVNLPHLTQLDLSRNKIKNIPNFITSINTLIQIDLSNNNISELPTFLIDKMPKMQIIDASGNNIKSVKSITLTIKNIRDPKPNATPTQTTSISTIRLKGNNLSNEELQELQTFVITD